ncbi:MAG: UDP-3-O-(3-hydroxymyristoyl)glucosamine N-acyltransferase [Desulfuromonadales bacterium]|nr:UDP-3-O-(3-hydroxymyristoyl)glucosamine N-acyltransferase [Desulfuromonadales bacterium]
MTEKNRGRSASLGELAELVGGRVSGDSSIIICGVASLDSAGSGEITFLSNPKLRSLLPQSEAAAIVVTPKLAENVDKPLLLVGNPYLAFAKLLTFFRVPAFKAEGISSGADVHPDAEIADNVTICSGCVVGAGARVAQGTILHPNVVIYPGANVGQDCVLHAGAIVREDCHLGERVILQPAAVVGSDGFGFAPDGEAYFKIPQVGRVIVEDDVEIGASSTIDRGTLGDTRIGRGTKIDNLVQVAHNVQIGENCILVSQVAIAGSTRIGDHSTFGGQSAAAGHLKVGSNVTIAARGGVTNDVADGTSLAGAPAIPHRDWLKASVSMIHLPNLRRDVSKLKQKLAELEAMLTEHED